MIYLRARFYAPEMNRFSQKDTLRGSVTQPGSLNRYVYVQNDPVNFMDPSGMHQVTGIYGDGTGRTTAQPKQTTPIITKPSQSANASIPVKNRTAPVRMTDTGTGSYTSSNNAAKQVGNAVTNKAHTGYSGNTAETYGTSHNSGAFAESPSVSGVGNERGFGCSKTINALGAGDYEGIGEVVKYAIQKSLETPILGLINKEAQVLHGIKLLFGDNGVFISGMTGSLQAGGRSSLFGGVILDTNGNVALIRTIGAGAGTASAALGLQFSYISAPAIHSVMDAQSVQVGGSVLSVGIDGIVLENKETESEYYGLSWSYSASAPAAELHAEVVQYSGISIIINIFEKTVELYQLVHEW